MSDMSKFKVGANTYDIKDEKSRGVPLTWAQYQALSYEEQHNGTAYYITDMDAVYPVDHELNANSRNAVANDIVTPHILAMENVLGAKNALPYPYKATTKTVNNVAFVDNGDGTITVNTVNGPCSAWTFFELQTPLSGLSYGDYKINGVPSGGGSSTYSIFAVTEGGATIWNYEGDADTTIDNSNKSINLYIGVPQGSVISTPITFKPMIRPAGTDPTYVPYAMTNAELTPSTSSSSGLTLIRIGNVRLLHFEGVANLITGQVIAEVDRPRSNVTGMAIVNDMNGQYHRIGALAIHSANGAIEAYAAQNYDVAATMDEVSSSSSTWIYGDMAWFV